MRNFQNTFERHKRSFIGAFYICMALPLKIIVVKSKLIHAINNKFESGVLLCFCSLRIKESGNGAGWQRNKEEEVLFCKVFNISISFLLSVKSYRNLKGI